MKRPYRALLDLFAIGPPTIDSDSLPAACVLVLHVLLLISMALNASWITVELFLPESGSPASPPNVGNASPTPLPSDGLEPSLKLRTGSKSCGEEADRELVDYLRNIVLIINAEHDRRGVNAGRFVRSVYGRVFDNVVVIGPEAIPSFGIEARGQRGLRSEWSYSYFYLPEIVTKYPDAEGFLWVEDDVVINYWTLLSANKSRLWYPAYPGCKKCQVFHPFNEDIQVEDHDGWSADPKVRRSVRVAMAKCEEHHILQYKESILPFKEGFHKRIVDMFYVPKRHARALAFELIPVFRDQYAKLQVAIPAMFLALDNPRMFDPILKRIVYRWHEEDMGLLFWNKTIPAYHPWQLTDPALREHSLRVLGQGDYCLLELIPSLKNASLYPP